MTGYFVIYERSHVLKLGAFLLLNVPHKLFSRIFCIATNRNILIILVHSLKEQEIMAKLVSEEAYVLHH